MRRVAAIAVTLSVAMASACGASKPPPPVIETQEAKLDPSRGGPAAATSSSSSSNNSDTSFANLGVPGMDSMGAPPSTPPSNADASSSVSSTPEVKLLEAGSAPRKELRHAFTRSRQKLQMKSKTRVSGANLPIPTITLDAPMDSEIVEVNKAGDARFKFSAGPFTSGSAGGGGLGALGGLFGGGGGGTPQKIAGWGWITSRGVVREYHVEEGAKDGDAPVESGDPFPDEAVGVGARWQVRQRLEEKDGPVQQTSVYELTKIDKAKKLVFTKVERVQQPLNGGTEGAAKSSGELVFHLGDVYPTGKLNMMRAMKLDIPGLEGGLKLASDVVITKR